jgi:hypothetical protein
VKLIETGSEGSEAIKIASNPAQRSRAGCSALPPDGGDAAPAGISDGINSVGRRSDGPVECKAVRIATHAHDRGPARSGARPARCLVP